MKTFAVAVLALVAVACSPLVDAQAATTKPPANATTPAANGSASEPSTKDPVFLPGVATPPGLGSDEGSGKDDAPMLTTGGSGTEDHTNHGSHAATPTATSKNSTVPTPSPKSDAHALVGVSVAAATVVSAVAAAFL